jgi:hypothetical protein
VDDAEETSERLPVVVRPRCWRDSTHERSVGRIAAKSVVVTARSVLVGASQRRQGPPAPVVLGRAQRGQRSPSTPVARASSRARYPVQQALQPASSSAAWPCHAGSVRGGPRRGAWGSRRALRRWARRSREVSCAPAWTAPGHRPEAVDTRARLRQDDWMPVSVTRSLSIASLLLLASCQGLPHAGPWVSESDVEHDPLCPGAPPPCPKEHNCVPIAARYLDDAGVCRQDASVACRSRRKSCTNVISYAKDFDGQILQFPNSCIPEGWPRVSLDADAAAGWSACGND